MAANAKEKEEHTGDQVLTRSALLGLEVKVDEQTLAVSSDPSKFPYAQGEEGEVSATAKMPVSGQVPSGLGANVPSGKQE